VLYTRTVTADYPWMAGLISCTRATTGASNGKVNLVIPAVTYLNQQHST